MRRRPSRRMLRSQPRSLPMPLPLSLLTTTTTALCPRSRCLPPQRMLQAWGLLLSQCPRQLLRLRLRMTCPPQMLGALRQQRWMHRPTATAPHLAAGNETHPPLPSARAPTQLTPVTMRRLRSRQLLTVWMLLLPLNYWMRVPLQNLTAGLMVLPL